MAYYQIYAFKTRQQIENVSSACSINCTITGAATTASSTNIIVLALYDEFMTIGIDDRHQYDSCSLKTN